MVNKIDGNGYSVYTRPQKVNIPDTGEKFSLDYQKDQLSSESKDKKEKEVSDQEKQQAAERSGVRIELSSKGVEKQKQAEAAEDSNASGMTSLLDSIRTFLAEAVTAVKDIFGRIWNDSQPEDAVQDISGTAENADALEGTETGIIKVTEIIEMTDFTENVEDVTGLSEKAENASSSTETPEDAAAFHTDAEKQDREIRRHLQNGDMNQVIRLLTNNGRRTAARNSTLLTYYDKNGRVVEPDPSIRERTLYGDRNARKL